MACTFSLLAACVAESGVPVESDADAGEDVASASSSVVDPTFASPTFLLSVVRVFTWRGMCSGTLIATNRVLMSAHCVCTENLVGGNVCALEATVRFRPDPSTGEQPDDIEGSVTYHPDYNPSWVDKELEHDLAVIALDAEAPAYITPMTLATTRPPDGTRVMIAGYGHTGSDCNGPGGERLGFDIVETDRTIDEGRMIQFDDPVACGGDSGGPILNRTGTVQYGVHSSGPPTLTYGYVDKSTLVQPYYAWIRSLTCSSSLWSICSDNANICRCSVGVGDCDTDADCLGTLRCGQNLGATFGYDATLDVCVPRTGPIEGTCTCRESTQSVMCRQATNGCSPGFSPACSPLSPRQGECGGCRCR